MADEKFCIVTGLGSHRDTWLNQAMVNGIDYVASDHVSQEDFFDAIEADQKKRGLGQVQEIDKDGNPVPLPPGTSIPIAQAKPSELPPTAPAVPGAGSSDSSIKAPTVSSPSGSSGGGNPTVTSASDTKVVIDSPTVSAPPAPPTQPVTPTVTATETKK